MTEPDTRRLFEANGCLAMAAGQLSGAREQLLGTGAGTYRRSCFASHQTIEMSLKGLIWFQTGNAPKHTHSFRKLIGSLDNYPEIQDALTRILDLEHIYIGSRYGYEDEDGNLILDYTKEEAKKAYDTAKFVYDAIRSNVPLLP